MENDGDVIGGGAGYGKSSITLKGSVIIRPLNISVGVTSVDGAFSGQGHIIVNPQAPEVVLYRESPLYGTIYNNALSTTYTLKASEITLHATPYFFSTTIPHQDRGVDYNWGINSEPVLAQNNGKNVITLREPQGITGTSLIDVKTTTPTNILQYTQTNISLNFTSN